MDPQELRAEAQDARREFWHTVNERIHGRAGQDRVRETGQFAEQAQQRWFEALQFSPGRAYVDPLPTRGDLARGGGSDRFNVARLISPAVGVDSQVLAEARARWDYVQQLRGERDVATKDFQQALHERMNGRASQLDLSGAADRADVAHLRWKTSYDLALHDPIATRFMTGAEIAAARVGREAAFRPDDWTGPSKSYAFVAERGGAKLAQVPADRREAAVEQAVHRAMPPLAEQRLPHLISAHLERERLVVRVYVPDEHARMLPTDPDRQTKFAAALREGIYEQKVRAEVERGGDVARGHAPELSGVKHDRNQHDAVQDRGPQPQRGPDADASRHTDSRGLDAAARGGAAERSDPRRSAAPDEARRAAHGAAQETPRAAAGPERDRGRELLQEHRSGDRGDRLGNITSERRSGPEPDGPRPSGGRDERTPAGDPALRAPARGGATTLGDHPESPGRYAGTAARDSSADGLAVAGRAALSDPGRGVHGMEAAARPVIDSGRAQLAALSPAERQAERALADVSAKAVSLADKATAMTPATAAKVATVAAGVAMEAGKTIAQTPANVMTRGM